MNRFKLMLAALIAIFFTACIQIEEEVELNNDGSGQINVKTDMGKLFEMVKTFASEEDLQKDNLAKSMDTLINLKDFIDTASNISAENKALLRDGVMKVKMNLKENLFNLDLKYPFRNASDANKLYSAINENGMMENALKGLNPNGSQAGAGSDPSMPAASGPGLEKFGSVYDISISKNEYKRTLNRARYDSLINDPKLQESKGMMAMMGDMAMNLTVKLPRKAKSVSNPKATLSDDKRTVTLKNDLTVALDSPENMEIIIKY